MLMTLTRLNFVFSTSDTQCYSIFFLFHQMKIIEQVDRDKNMLQFILYYASQSSLLFMVFFLNSTFFLFIFITHKL